MKKVLALAALVMGACGAAQAGDFYVAGDITKTRFSGLGNDQGFSLAGGYKFNENWAAELGYRFLGSDTQTIAIADSGNKATLSARYRSIQLSALGMLPMTDRFSVFARLGYGTIKSQDSISVTSGSASSDFRSKEYSSGLLAGVGVEYAFTKQISVRGEYQRPASDVSLLAVGLKYGF